MTGKNARPLEKIANEIHALERNNIFDVGQLLIEAKESCDHGEWLAWLTDSDFLFSADTAERYMNAASLVAKFRTVRNLKRCMSSMKKKERPRKQFRPAIFGTLYLRHR